MEQNHYYVLGINKSADLNKIKHAYRVAARRYHPDSETGNPEEFRRVQEAYEVLGDAQRRTSYDLRSETAANRGEPWASDYGRPQHERVRPRNMSWDADRYSSVTDEFLRGFIPGFFDRPIKREKDFYMDLVLSRYEAFEGGYIPIEMPAITSCPRCRGASSPAVNSCSYCLGFGEIQSVRRFSLFVPPGTHGGVEEVVPLDEIGLRGSNLHITVIVADG